MEELSKDELDQLHSLSFRKDETSKKTLDRLETLFFYKDFYTKLHDHQSANLILKEIQKELYFDYLLNDAT